MTELFESQAVEGPLLLPVGFYAPAYPGPAQTKTALRQEQGGTPGVRGDPSLANPHDGVQAMGFDIYAEVTGKIVSMLEAGVVPWRSPILGQIHGGWPKNLDMGKDYRGVNVFLLAFTAWAKGYASAHWLTFNQARQRGGSVKKGEKSSMVVFWKLYETRDERTDKLVTVPVLRYFNVFNVEQCEGITMPDAPAAEAAPIPAAERIVNGYEGRPEIEHRGGRAYYVPKQDAVHIPSPSRFTSGEAYYATLFHELAHSTGHSSRLDRGIDTKLAPFGSPDYGREELVAEMAAAFLCGHAGITPATVENSAAYIGGWIKTLKSDNRLAIAAAGAAQKAADWIRGWRGTQENAAIPVNSGPPEAASVVVTTRTASEAA